MENLIVGPAGAAVSASDGTVVGRRGIVPVRVVSALPVSGVEIVPAFATGNALALLGDMSAPSAMAQGVVGSGRVYVSRMVWATSI